jgi:hypothetical protein
MRLDDWDGNKLSQFCNDVENKRKSKLKLGTGYAGIKTFFVNMDNLAVPGLGQSLQWISPQEIHVWAFPLLTLGAWEKVTSFLSSQCRKLSLKTCVS